MKTNVRLLVVLAAFIACALPWATVSGAADADILDESAIQAYLEKHALPDPGSCLVDKMKVDIIGIADLVPGHQANVFYTYESLLKCNRGNETKSGKGVLTAIRLRDGRWMDRETMAEISK